MIKRRNISDIGICAVPSVTVHEKPDYMSAFRGQMIMGEQADVINIKNKHWIKVRCVENNLVGWVNPQQFVYSNSPYSNDMTSINLDLNGLAYHDTKTILLPIACYLPHYDGLTFRLNDQKYQYSGTVMQTRLEDITETLLSTVLRRFLYITELKGGKTIFGIDRKHLVVLIYRCFKVFLPYDDEVLMQTGEIVHFVEQIRIGDLIFLKNEDGIHYGVAISPSEVIHCDGLVRIDKIDHLGVFDSIRNRYTYELVIVRRILNVQVTSSNNEEITNS